MYYLFVLRFLKAVFTIRNIHFSTELFIVFHFDMCSTEFRFNLQFEIVNRANTQNIEYRACFLNSSALVWADCPNLNLAAMRHPQRFTNIQIFFFVCVFLSNIMSQAHGSLVQ